MMLLKTTNGRKAVEKQRYDDACGTAHALELIGDRWAILIVRELMLGGRRFSQLRADLPGISANVLTQRLSELEGNCLVVRKRLPSPASVHVYELTPWGYEAEPIIQTMGRWAARSPYHDPNLRISGVSSLLSLRTMLDRDRARGIDAVIGFRFGEDVYRGHLTADGFPVVRAEPDEADLVFDGQPAALMAAVHGGVPFTKLKAAGTLTVIGDRGLARRFTTLFPLPQKLSL
jgi:DNA-binding HxlR family transcriptional regulator